MNDEGKISKNKVMRLREVLSEPDTSQQLFVKELIQQGYKLPNNADKLFEDNKLTPFFDAIELRDFYPEKLLKI